MSADYIKLEKNITQMILEQQIKIGFLKECVRLYYPKESLCKLLDIDVDDNALFENSISGFCRFEESRMGRIDISHSDGRYCLLCSEEVSEYVHLHGEDSSFLRELIGAVSTHGSTMEQIISIFDKYSDRVCKRKAEIPDFDMILYFEDGYPDDFVYCLADEGEHVIYHRFTVDDFRDIYDSEE